MELPDTNSFPSPRSPSLSSGSKSESLSNMRKSLKSPSSIHKDSSIFKLCEQIMILAEPADGNSSILSPNKAVASKLEITAKTSLIRLVEELRTIKAEASTKTRSNSMSGAQMKLSRSPSLRNRNSTLAPIPKDKEKESHNNNPLSQRIKTFLGIGKSEQDDVSPRSDANVEDRSRSVATQTEANFDLISEGDRIVHATPLSWFQNRRALDILALVFSHLDVRDLCRSASVCSVWKNAAESWVVWKSLYAKYFPISLEYEEDPDLAADLWKSHFIDSYSYTRNLYDESNGQGIISALKNNVLSQIKVYSSSLKRGTISDFISTEDVHLWTDNAQYSWFAVDLGEGKAVIPTHYKMKYGSSGNYCCPRNWLLQATNDPDAVRIVSSLDPKVDPMWDTLMEHENDASINASFSSVTWKVNKNNKRAYRIFRIIQTGFNSYYSGKTNDDWSLVLVASGFEVFGLLKQKKNTFREQGIIQILGGYPHVQVYASSVERGAVQDFISQRNAFFWTKNQPYSWCAIDLGKNKAALLTHYKIKYGSSGEACCPRNWLLQGTNSLEALKKSHDIYHPSWHTLSVHSNDATLDSGFAENIWPVTPPQPYRIFRIIQTGRNKFLYNHNQKDEWSEVLVMSGFEIFGQLIDTHR